MLARFLEMNSQQAIAYVTLALEFCGMGGILFGAIFSVIKIAVSGNAPNRLPQFRRELGQWILVSLELFVAADIVKTIGLQPSYKDLLVLVSIVFLRTFLSFSMEVEINGRWPWKKGP